LRLTAKRAYNTRSKLVHGGMVKGGLGSQRDSARHLAAVGLVKALFNGWPTADDFIVDALVGDSSDPFRSFPTATQPASGPPNRLDKHNDKDEDKHSTNRN
jgi:hypothetical protein